MSDTEETTKWYIKRLGGEFFKFVEMIFIKSSQKFSVSLVLSIGFRKLSKFGSGREWPIFWANWSLYQKTFSWIGRSVLWLMLYGFES